MIRVLITGGTFDKEYDELQGRLYFKDTHLPEMLRLGRCRVPVAVETVMLMPTRSPVSLRAEAAPRMRPPSRTAAAPAQTLR